MMKANKKILTKATDKMKNTHESIQSVEEIDENKSSTFKTLNQIKRQMLKI